MPPNLFLTGATGFVGGDVLHTISHAHPFWQWTCLVRSKAKGAVVSAAYPSARIVYSDINDTALLEEEAGKADIVIHACGGSDEHVAAAEAIVCGLKRRVDGSGGRRTACYLHTGGAFSLGTNTLELTSHPEHAPHRKVDKVVLAAGSQSEDKIKTALLAPAIIYGAGRGPDKKKTFPMFGGFLQHRKVFGVGKGENIWHYVHVQDLSAIYLRLVDLAVTDAGSAGCWNEGGYYLAENGFYVTREMLQLAAKIGYEKGFLESSEAVFLSPEAADELLPYSSIVLGVESRGMAYRARKLLGWKPRMSSFEDEIGNAFDAEARNMT